MGSTAHAFREREAVMTIRLPRRRLLTAALAGTVAVPLVAIRTRPASAAEFSYKYANNSPVTHPLNIRTSEAAARILEKTGGKVEIKVFPNNQLGSDTDMLSQLRSGALEFFTLSGLILSTLVPVASINGVGFAFKDYGQVWPAMDGALGTLVRNEIGKRGLYAFAKMYDNGYRQITSATKPIKTPEDLSGFKIRVPASPLWTSLFKAFGASPTTINFNEVYSALQTHVVDGQENPLALIDTAKLYEVQKYVAITNHMWDGFWMLANKRAFDAMPANLREIVEAEFNASAIAERADLATMNNTVAATLKSKGLQFVDTDATVFRGALKKAGFYEEWRGKFGPEAWGVLEKAVGSLA
jgi:tripartite ATP-independent transporter DctP family solute receptor